MTRQIKRSIVVPFRLALLTLAATVGCRPSAAGAVRFETVKASRGDLVQHVTASGSLSAVVSVDVGSQVSGKVAARHQGAAGRRDRLHGIRGGAATVRR
jgi:multidrug efflux pump subunit AcrA (membrane-fusion protein)